MARMSKAEKALEKAYYDAFGRLGSNIQFDVMELGKMKGEALAAAQGGTPMDEAVAAGVAKYRKN